MRKTLFILAAMILTLCGCSKDDANFDLGTPAAEGTNCLVKELVLNDTLKATVDVQKRLLKVKVPIDFKKEKRSMKITKLSLSDGAQCDIKQGETINLDAPQIVTVRNGDIILKYQLAVINDEAKIYNFVLAGKKSVVNHIDKTITVSVAANEGIDLSNAKFEIVASEDATCTPASGTMADFSDPEHPVTIEVRDRTAYEKYTVKVTLITAPVALIVGDAEYPDAIESLEEKEAARGFTAAIPNSMYMSWDDLVEGSIDLSKVRMIYFHRHCSPYSRYKDFADAETKAMNALETVKGFWNRGVGIFLSRSAIGYAIALGAMPEDAYPNNVFSNAAPAEGNIMQEADPLHFYTPNLDHPLWANLKKGPDPNGIYTVDTGHSLCNTVLQFGFFGDYQTGNAAVEAKTGGRVLVCIDNKECPAWELKAKNGEFGKGGVICMGAGAFDWYSPTDFTPNLHDNMGQIMLNALEYIGK